MAEAVAAREAAVAVVWRWLATRAAAMAMAALGATIARKTVVDQLTSLSPIASKCFLRIL